MIITRIFEPNKKLRRARFAPGAFVIAESFLKTFEYHSSGGEVYTWHPNFTDITAADWEVVEEQTIEVGDTVRRKDGQVELEVIWLSEWSKKAFVRKGPDKPFEQDLEDLTLIRKGPAKPVELAWGDVKDLNYADFATKVLCAVKIAPFKEGEHVEIVIRRPQ